MPTRPRIISPGLPLHIVQRGNNRAPIFSAEQDYLYFLELLGDAARAAGCVLHAYVLMTNHFHLLVTPETVSAPAKVMEAVGRRYVRYFNAINHRTGSLWEGRYRSGPVDSVKHLIVCSCYIELNPVRAGMVSDPSGYRWSSFRCNALGQPDALVTPHPVYLALGEGEFARREAYQGFFARSLDREVMDGIRRDAQLEVLRRGIAIRANDGSESAGTGAGDRTEV